MIEVTFRWRNTRSEGFPTDPVKDDIPCLVRKGKEIMVLVWNNYHVCWDDESGDDFYCHPGDVSDWVPLSELWPHESSS